MRRKITAWLLAIVMVATMMPTKIWQASALEAKDAGSDPNGAQIGLHYDVSQENGTFSGNPTLSGDTYESNTKGNNDNIGQNDDDWRVWVDKTIAKQNPEKENEFDITLTVKTRSEIVAPQKDTSVVLVLDLSSSMVKNKIPNKNPNEEDKTRLEAAKDAANEFITYYAGIAQGKRNIAIVGFNETSWSVLDWKTLGEQNTATHITADSVKSTIEGLTTEQGTNLEAGLLSAYSLLKDAPTGEKMVVLLSDGEPTCYVPSTEKGTVKDSYSNAADMGWGSGWPTNPDRHNAHIGALNAASKITGTSTNQLGSEIRTIFCGSQNCNLDGSTKKGYACAEKMDGNQTCGRTTTVSLLEEMSGDTNVYETYEVSQLEAAFDDIVQQIELLTQAWQSTDPMGTNTDWKGMVTDNNEGVVEGVVATSDNLTWDLTQTDPLEGIGDDGRPVYTYSVAYKVKLDTLADKFDFNKWYATNGATELKYFFEEENEVKSIWFNVPTIQGYKGGYYKLIKVDENGNGLGGAEFTLEHNCGGDCTAAWSKVYASDSRGYVEMVNIPSGHEYILSETSAPEGYVGSNETHKLEVRYGEVYIDGELNKPLTIVNEKAVIDIPVTKVWVDNDNQDGKRPETIKINLLADGDKVQEITLSENFFGNWEHTFENLPRFKDGGKIVYTVQEEDVNGYTKTISKNEENNGFTVTNTHSPEVIDIPATKVWDDNNNQDGKRPNSITVNLVADGNVVEGKTITLNEANEWTGSFQGLPKYAEGKEIEYTVTEDKVAEYDKPVVTGNIDDGYTITNKHTPETLTIPVNKVWNDHKNQDNTRPDEITVNLTGSYVKGDNKYYVAKDLSVSTTETAYESRTVTAEDNWAVTFTNLPKYVDGNEISWVVTEDDVYLYSTTIRAGEETGYVITNTYPAVVEIPVAKVWDDGNDQDRIRPESITARLYANGTEVKTQQLTADNDWAYKFTGLPKYDENDELITYTVREDKVAGYDNPVVDGDVANGFTITNTHRPEVINVPVTKIWDDDNNRDGARPDSITVKLLANGKETDKTLALTKANDWKGTFEGLAKNEAGTAITYTVEEVAVNGYETATEGDVINGYKITNTRPIEKITISGSKAWEDAENQDGIRPESITVNLLADGNKIDSKTVTAVNNWTWSFTNLPKYAEGKVKQEIVYSVSEEPVEGYEKVTVTGDVADGFTITNTRIPDVINIPVTKTWDDDNNRDGIRPDSITVELLANGDETGKTLVLTKENNWKGAFEGLAKNEAGTAITYTVEEVAVEGYTSVVDGTTITNKHTPETVDIKGSKIWNDDSNRDRVRPESITVKLLANGDEVEGKTATVTGEGDEWTYEFTGLPKYNNGVEINYTVKEDVVEGYTTVVKGTTITNIHTPETVNIVGSKIWNDKSNQDGIRPEEITVRLFADGEEVEGKTATVTGEGDEWTYEFTGLPKYNNGVEINYTVKEDVVEGYTTVVEGTTITNTHKPKTVDIAGTKTWNDKGNQDGVRPTSIIVNLLANGKVIDTKEVTGEGNIWSYEFNGLDKFVNGEEIVYTVSEEPVAGYVTTYDGNNIINKYDPKTTAITVVKSWDDNNDQDRARPESIKVVLKADGEATDQTLTLNKANSWTGAFKNLDKFANGKEIVYTVEEVAVDGYTTSIEMVGTVFTITNTHKPAEVEVPVTKVWEDDSNRDGARPETITFKLYADGKEVTSKEVTGEGNTWSYVFKNLPKYDAGNEIEYTVTEEAVTGYTSSMTGTAADGFTFTNTHEVEQTSVNVVKVWNDADDQDGLRPDSIEVELYADGVATGNKLTLNASNDWSGKFTELEKNNNGKVIEYTVKESNIPEAYKVTVTGNQKVGYTITNTYTPEVVAVKGTKVWNDASNQDGVRPAEITVKLYADGKEVDSQTVTGSDDTWEYVFNNLPKYNKGVEIVYTVDEVAVDGYSTSINGTTITNTHNVEKTNISGTKTWNDAENQDGKRPEAIQIDLLANGQKVDSKTVTAEDGWTWTFANLDKFAAGEEIVYTYSEVAVDDYSVTYEGTDVINEWTPEKTSVTVSKTWNDDNNRDGIRPDSVTVELYADGVSTGKTLELTEEGNWIGSFTGLDKYKAEGVEIAYTVAEVAVNGYETAITGDATNGYNITNTHNVETVSVEGNKTWIDANNQDGKRPEAITVNLLADGEEIDQAVVGEAEGWAWTFDNLPKYKDGKAIEYTVTEDKVEGYVTEVNGYDITNTYEIETTEITITKGWMEDNKKDRPESIQVNILANGELYRTVELTEAGGWELTVTDLPMYTEGEVGVIAVYSIDEVKVPGYEAEIEGFDIFNTKVDPSDDSEQDKDKDKDGKDKDKDGDKDSAKTGDNMNLMALAGTALAALAAAFVAIFRRKKNA